MSFNDVVYCAIALIYFGCNGNDDRGVKDYHNIIFVSLSFSTVFFCRVSSSLSSNGMSFKRKLRLHRRQSLCCVFTEHFFVVVEKYLSFIIESRWFRYLRYKPLLPSLVLISTTLNHVCEYFAEVFQCSLCVYAFLVFLLRRELFTNPFGCSSMEWQLETRLKRQDPVTLTYSTHRGVRLRVKTM